VALLFSKWIFRLVAVTAIVAISWVGFCAWRGVTTSLEAEKTLHVYTATLDILTVYLKHNHGKWPTSWDDLVGVSPSSQIPDYRWPEDIAEFRKRVRIDFELTGAQVAAMDPEHFSAVEQIGPNYGPNEAWIRQLLNVARRYREGNRA
jgi:hypothetical protein